MISNKLWRNEKGFSLMEVLIASTVFMIGFTIMVFLLSQITGKYSSKEKIIAYQLAVSKMEETLASGDYISGSLTETSSGLTFIIDRLVEQQEKLITIRINITRASTGKTLISLYNEKYIR
ncbi:MAG: prepilin-type N-terminal cleavage/methylation domain-containing protein [candidate division Zixibacteria bacterium]|nr:prepilin-type N-terminal cleavage/methylation domain-containing protein [candidate division Zixibacteria bacterium]